MKLAVFHNLPSGGALRVLHDKLKNFKERGHSASLYSFSTADHDFLKLDRWVDRLHIEPLRFEGLLRFRNYFRATRRVAEAINRSDAEWVFVSKCRVFGSPPIMRYLKKPIVFYSHEPLRIRKYEMMAKGNRHAAPGYFTNFMKLPLAHKIKKLLRSHTHFFIKAEDRRNIRNAPLVMTNSHFTAGWLRRVYGVEAKVNYQGVDTAFFHPSPDAEKKDHVLSVGRVDETKGHGFILRALGRVEKSVRPALIIVCDRINPRILKGLEKDAAQLGVSCDVRFRISDESLRALYRTSRLVLCASVNEPFGLVPLEAMACGVPVLAVNEGGFLETVTDERTGFLLERDETLWARKIEACLSDPSAMRRMGEAGRSEALSRWTWDPFVDRMEKAMKDERS